MSKWGLYLKLGAVFGFTILTLAQARGQETSQKSLKKSKSLVRKAEKAKKDKDFAKAEAYYRRALGKEPENARANYNFGHLYTDHEKEIESMNQLLKTVKNAKTKPLKHKAFHNLGNAYMREEDYGQAVKAYKDALRNDPGDDQTRYNLALAKDKLEKNPDKNKKDKDKKDDDKNKDKDKKDKSKNKKNRDKNDKDKKEQKDKDKDKGDNQEKNKDQKKSGNKKQKKSENKDKDQKNQQKQGQKKPQEGEMSKKQAKNLLRAAKNLEKKVQQKKRKRKAKKATKKHNEKNW